MNTYVFSVLFLFTTACGQPKQSIQYQGFGANEVIGGSLHKVMIGSNNLVIDAGVFYGQEYDNYPLPKELDVKKIDAIFLTHAHADHIGRIPLLVEKGYNNPIYSTRVTRDLTLISIVRNIKYTDFGTETFYYSKNNKQEKKPVYMDRFSYGKYEVKSKNRVYLHCKRSELDSLGFYLSNETTQFLSNEIKTKLERLFKTVDYEEVVTIADNIKVQFFHTSHLPGASMVYVQALGKNILFSGDMGSDNSPFLVTNTTFPHPVDYLFVEATYGLTKLENDNKSQREDFIKTIANALSKKKRVIIPAFAVDRTQQVLYEISRGMNEMSQINKNTKVKVFSPTAEDVIRLYQYYSKNESQYRGYFSDKMFGNIFNIKNLQINPTVKNGNMFDLNIEQGEIAIMTSGMIVGGFSKEITKSHVSDTNSIFISVSYQDEGELGGQLFKGKSILHFDDKDVQVKAQIFSSNAFSGHAHIGQIIKVFKKITPEKILIVHLNKNDGNNIREHYKTQFPSAQILIPEFKKEYELK